MIQGLLSNLCDKENADEQSNEQMAFKLYCIAMVQLMSEFTIAHVCLHKTW